MAQSAVIPQRVRNDGKYSPSSDSLFVPLMDQESWVEISSQPSSSSLSSIGDEIVTTGLRVQHDPNIRRRRRISTILPQAALQPRHAGTSSQEEYEESESEEDRLMTSSTEQISPPQPKAHVAQPVYDAGSDSDDDDENATALGRRTSTTNAFTPQPNAFSHPPTSHTQRTAVHGSYFPSPRPARCERPDYISRTSSHAADHDAALRASLTTLLSIGAAAGRSLPKREHGGGIGRTIHSSEPMGLRFVPESELNNPTIPANTGRPLSPSTRARSSPSVSSQDAIEQGKRKAVTTKPSGDKSRPVKKKKLQVIEGETLLSPTLMAWFMSAGVVVLVSVVGFGAGYVIGREVGRQEVIAGMNGTSLVDSGSCGREAVKSTGSLRRFRWNMGSGGSVLA